MLCHLYITLGTMSMCDLVMSSLTSCIFLSGVCMLCHLYIMLGPISMCDFVMSSLNILHYSECLLVINCHSVFLCHASNPNQQVALSYK